MKARLQFDRRRFVLGSGIALCSISAPSILRAQDTGEALATTANGRIRGVRDRGISIFRGIPYGGSVSGPARFKAAPPPPAWTGVRDAIRLGAPSIQPPNQTSGVNEPAPAEDCLFLNVWTPAADGKRRPVMFYSHGGGFTTGSGGALIQDGGNLAREYDVVVVESNHRLGLMGYLFLRDLLGPEYQGNQGLSDLVAALRWVNINISRFGGDPDNVMIFGESGGGSKTTALYSMPLASRFFNKASIESSAPIGNAPPDHGTEVTKMALQRLGIAPSDARKILEVPVEQLLKVQMGDGPNLGPGTLPPPGTPVGQPGINFGPVIDGAILPEVPFTNSAPSVSARKPLIVGGCKDETVFFNRLDTAVFTLDEEGLKQRLQRPLGADADAWIAAFKQSRPNASPSQLFIAITTAMPWRAHAIHLAEMKAAQGAAPVYSYILSYNSPTTIPGTDYRIGSPHASDIQTKFDNVRPDPSAPPRPNGFFSDQSEARLQTASHMSEMWATFARTGRPAAKGQPEWPAYTLPQRATMIIDSECKVENDPEGAERSFWEARNVTGARGP